MMETKKIVLITGTTSGIGEVVAQYLDAKGFDVVGTYRRKKNPRQSFLQIRLDVTEVDSIEAATEKVINEKGRVDVLVNNAGYGISGPAEEMEMSDIQALFDTNFFGSVRMIQAILPGMRERREGKILNISSIGGLIGLPFQAYYAATKFALEGFTESLRMEVKPFGIQVANINPGDFRTGFTVNRRNLVETESPYSRQYHKTKSIFEKDENNGSDPVLIAKLIEELIQTDKALKVRYLVGKSEQKLGPLFKKILGSKTFEKLMCRVYGVN